MRIPPSEALVATPPRCGEAQVYMDCVTNAAPFLAPFYRQFFLKIDVFWA
jgi:hypothetical protein